jgi:energy-converting hydrogenase B subunit D
VSTLQAVACVAVAVAATVTVAVRDPVRQAVLSGFLGLALTVFFFSFGAADVALSQLVVSAIALPAMVLLALAKLARVRPRDGDGDQ